MNSNIKQPLVLATAGLGLALAGRALYRRMNRLNLAGRTVLITGSSRGLGLVLARQFAAEGANLILCGRNKDKLLQAGKELFEKGANVSCVTCDVTQPEQVQDMVTQIEQHFSSIDVVVNNAGIIQVGPMESMERQDYQETMQTHFYGPLHVIEAVLPGMRKRGAGRIVNISSVGGRISLPHMLPYSASKFALVGYSLGLRSELAKEGIGVVTVCPGMMRTGSPQNAYFKGQHEAEYALFKISDSLPLVSMSSERAARQILKACQHNDGFLVLGLHTKLAEKLYALCPGLMADALGVVNRILPAAGPAGSVKKQGSESQSRWSESWLTELTQKAAERNNEL